MQPTRGRRSGHDPPAGHRIEVQHAAAMADRGIEVLLGNLVELDLGGDEVAGAPLAGNVEPVGFVADLASLRDDLAPQRLDLPASDGVFLDRLLDIDEGLTFDV